LRFESFARTITNFADKRLAAHITCWSLGEFEDSNVRERKKYERSDLEGLKADYDGVESYLNEVIKEFETKFHELRGDDVPLRNLPTLCLLVTSTDNFRTGTSRRVRRIQRVLQSALLVPLELPTQAANTFQAPPA
jgi:hypothetical protein